MLSETELYGFSCLRCKAITRSAGKITVPGDDTATFLTLGQREQVYCPVCREMRQGEFVVITNMNATRVVDASGCQVYPHGLGGTFGPPPTSSASPNFAPQQQQLPTGNFLQGTVAPPGTAPSPFNGNIFGSATTPAASPSQPPTAFAMPSNPAFEKYLLSASDEDVKAMKKDLHHKLQIVESALAERKKCIVCCERDKCVVLLPCKHMSMCQECSEKVKECPICKQVVVDRIVPFSS